METGTGKTYVYLRTIMELYEKYGFSKHIIVVPSISIKEGVYKSLQITEEHFKQLYDKSENKKLSPVLNNRGEFKSIMTSPIQGLSLNIQ